MTWEEWNALSEEEQASRIAEKPAGDNPASQGDDFVMIGGKKRPLSNFMAEITRKVGEDIISRMPKPEPKVEPKRVDPSDDAVMKRIRQDAEDEMEKTGSVVPINTIANLVMQGTSNLMRRQKELESNSAKIKKDVKRELKSKYKDYVDFSDEFEDILDAVDPSNTSKDGLVMIFDSLRGKRFTELKEKIDKGGDDKPSKKIIGDIDTPSGSARPSSAGAKSKLSEEQKQEMMLMNFDSEEDYLGRLAKYQEIGKNKGARNKPSLLQEKLLIPQV